MAQSSNIAWQSAARVARLLGIDGDDVTRQINVHTQRGRHKQNVLVFHLRTLLMAFLLYFWLFRKQKCQNETVQGFGLLAVTTC